MTASKMPEPDPRDDDATTEVLAGLDADHTPTEVLDGERGAQATAVLPETADTRATQVLPETADARTTQVLPETADARVAGDRTETLGRAGYAAPEASAPRPDAQAGLTPPPAPSTPAPAPAAAPVAAEPALRARVRWAGIIWGLVFAVTAISMLWVLADPERREAVGLWWAGLTPAGLGLTALIVAGGLLLIGGLTGLARHLSTRQHA
ncbi:hypothetical protein [Agromyces aerolatus]|uniref:hypothetical protein n=1 Tax=Agromyces sp. LY-1074 TaxID=3074080 RepID=UPI0028667951|nr:MULTISPECIES: hypothetical protein [unclassified Agromyces]MDR5701261.1 hypothetical protein [Agromyces sp. LY-1074]MDR5706863.1 hypothetical protein [Agromyces sp. LY-1358]